MPDPARAAAEDLLARLDRAAPGRITGFYLVGSASMGAFQPGRSDVDFVAIVGGGVGAIELRKLHAVHLGRWTSALLRDAALGRRWPLVCNGIYLEAGDVARSPLGITPLAAHAAGRFRVRPHGGSDANPVTWHVLARHGIGLRGPGPDRLGVRTDASELRSWVLDNLNSYWRRWSTRVRPAGLSIRAVTPRRLAASGVLGVTRLHYTIATGEITAEPAAGLYALEVFEPRWHPLIEDAEAYWRGEPPAAFYRRLPQRRYRDAAEFVSYVIDAGNRLARTGSG